MRTIILWLQCIIQPPLRQVIIFFIIIGLIMAAYIVYGDTMFDDVRYATVEIKNGNGGGGSGFIIDIDETYLHILTARHMVCEKGNTNVVDGTVIQVKGKYWVDRMEVFWEDISIDDELDIAYLRVYKNKFFWRDYKKVNIAPEAPVIGDVIYSIGHPFSEFHYMINKGILSTETDLLFYKVGQKERIFRDADVFTMSCYPGNSGGPAFNEDGEVVSIMFGVLYQLRGRFATEKQLYNNIAYGIKHEDIVKFLKKVEEEYEELDNPTNKE